MKKTLIVVLALVLMFALSLVVFVGCNKDGEEPVAKASNSETLGTAVAVAASYAGGGASSSSEEDTGSFKAGIDLSVNVFGVAGAISATAETAFDAISQIIEPMVASGIDSVSTFLNENGVTVGAVDSDDTNYSNKYAITVTHTDEATGEEVTDEYALYVNVAKDVDIEGTNTYDFTAKMVLAESVSFTFGGTATYNTEKDTTVFSLDLNIAGMATLDIEAYATARGGIVVEIGGGLGESFADAKVTIEVGKLANGAYGAEITVAGSVNVAGVGAEVLIKVNATGAYEAATHSYNLGGEVNATVTLPLFGKYNANGNINGMAQYNTDEDAFEIGITGTLTLSQVEEDAE